MFKKEGDVTLVVKGQTSYFYVIDEKGLECEVSASNKVIHKVMSRKNYKKELINLVKANRKIEGELGGELVRLNLIERER